MLESPGLENLPRPPYLPSILPIPLNLPRSLP